MPDGRPIVLCAAYTSMLSVGDTVYLQSDGSSLPYIALVENVAGSTILCRWLYRHSELPSKLRSAVAADDRELFLFTHTDPNDIDSVLGRCDVLLGCDASSTAATDVHFCRYAYNTKKAQLMAWKDLPPSLQKRWSNIGDKPSACCSAEATQVSPDEPMHRCGSTATCM